MYEQRAFKHDQCVNHDAHTVPYPMCPFQPGWRQANCLEEGSAVVGFPVSAAVFGQSQLLCLASCSAHFHYLWSQMLLQKFAQMGAEEPVTPARLSHHTTMQPLTQHHATTDTSPFDRSITQCHVAASIDTDSRLTHRLLVSVSISAELLWWLCDIPRCCCCRLFDIPRCCCRFWETFRAN